MVHLHEIITFLNEKRIKIHPPLWASNGSGDYTAELNLQKENFGVFGDRTQNVSQRSENLGDHQIE